MIGYSSRIVIYKKITIITFEFEQDKEIKILFFLLLLTYFDCYSATYLKYIFIWEYNFIKKVNLKKTY